MDFNNLGIKVSYKLILSLLMGMIKHSESSQSNKFSISFQYLKKEVINGVLFYMQINIKSVQVDIIAFDGIGKTCSKYPKNFYCDTNIQIFCLKIRCFVGVQSCSSLLAKYIYCMFWYLKFWASVKILVLFSRTSLCWKTSFGVPEFFFFLHWT